MPPSALASNQLSSTKTSQGNTLADIEAWQTFVDVGVMTVQAPDIRGRLENALDNFAQTQTPFMDSYILLSAAYRRQGGQGVVQFARGVRDGQDYAIKFFTERSAFDQEFNLYSNPVLRSMMPAVTRIEPNIDGSICSSHGWPLPPCIVIERGESLDNWAKRIKPDFTTILQVLTHVATRLQHLHDNGLVHRDLKPGNVLWRPQHLEWTLIDFGCAAHIGDIAPLSFSLKYSPPEVIRAYEKKESSILVTAEMDMWSFGLMAFELLTGHSVFQPYTPPEEVCDRIVGRKWLPWEDPEIKDQKLKKLRMLRRTIEKCLDRDATERPSSTDLLTAWNRLFDINDRTMT